VRERLKFELLHVLMIFVLLFSIREERAGGSKHVMRNLNPFTASGECSLVRFIVSIALDCKKTYGCFSKWLTQCLCCTVHDYGLVDPGTATFPSHRFVMTPVEDPDTVLITFIVQNYPENIYVFNPYLVEGDPEATAKNLAEHLTTESERQQYEMWRKTISFNEQYRNFTGRSYLANYLRPPPQHFMWRGDYFGQQHFVETLETHFIQEPPKEFLEPILAHGKKRRIAIGAPRILQEYRAPGRMNMTLTVLSVAPRVFQIDNFLSPVEVDHITELASGIKLSLSATGEDEPGAKRVPENETSSTIRTRTSYNSWVPREKSPIIDAIYRRAADLLRIDEALFRSRDEGEVPERDDYRKTLAEDLQLVNYKERQGKQRLV
jgi:hypothetical protein